MIYRQNDPSRASNRTNDAMHPVGNDENHGVDSQASRHSHVGMYPVKSYSKQFLSSGPIASQFFFVKLIFRQN